MSRLIVPKRKRGGQSQAAKERFERERREFIQLMLRIESTRDSPVGSRGWCYLLEEHGLWKGDFDDAQEAINKWRKEGLFPPGLFAPDPGRAFHCDELPTAMTEEEYAESSLGWLFDAPNQYGVSFWEHQPVRILMTVEKIDLFYLFKPVCEKYCVPLANTKGWGDINQREEIAQRFKEHDDPIIRPGQEIHFRKQVVLHCGDFDPYGLLISEKMEKGIKELHPTTGYSGNFLVVDRFGLNYDFIEANGLTWIENLKTGGKQEKGKIKDLADRRHPRHYDPFVQDYIAKYGPKKVEANALVVAPEMGRKLCEEAILKHLPDNALARHEMRQKEARSKVRAHLVKAIKATDWEKTIDRLEAEEDGE